jgi:hypothetical protein
MRLSDKQAAFLLDVCKLVVFATSRGWTVTPGEARRTPEQQAIYVKTGRSKTMKSMHLIGLAMDFNFLKDGQVIWDKGRLQEVGNYWESLDPKNEWGGNWSTFKDVPHFQRNE